MSRPPVALGYQRSLDGLRGLALLAIVVYHSGLDWMPGAFLSVSTFFTLSGFLITAVMLSEHARTGRISLGRFWARRLRRLLPAALVAVTGIALAAALLADSPQLGRLRGDGLASLGYVANWRFIAMGDSYGEQFTSPSPFTHFWTLAIEEQFYVVLPLVLVGVLALGRGNRRALAVALGALAAASVAWSAVLVQRGAALDRIYFGTDTRAAELLTGALLALWWLRRPEPLAPRGERVLRIVGVGALALVVALWATASLGQRAYYQGGLAAYSLLTLVVLVAAMRTGVVARVLAWRPLVAVGVVSYGAYLFHWPILVWLDLHTGLSPLGRLLLGLPATLALATLSHRYVERPIREGRLVTTGRARYVTPTAIAATLAIVLVVAVARPGEEPYDFESALAESRGPEATASPTELEDIARFYELNQLRADLAATGVPKLASYGDSTALITGLGLSRFGEAEFKNSGTAVFRPTLGFAQLGCGLISDGARKLGEKKGAPLKECDRWWEQWAATAADNPVDIAFISLGTWDVLDQQPAGFDAPVAIGDPALDALLAERLDQGLDALRGSARLTVLALPPVNEVGRIDGRSPDEAFPESDPARMARLRALFEAAAAARPDVETVDLGAWIAARPDERQMRPDGIHLTDEAALTTAAWLGPELVRVFEAWQEDVP